MRTFLYIYGNKTLCYFDNLNSGTLPGEICVIQKLAPAALLIGSMVLAGCGGGSAPPAPPQAPVPPVSAPVPVPVLPAPPPAQALPETAYVLTPVTTNLRHAQGTRTELAFSGKSTTARGTTYLKITADGRFEPVTVTSREDGSFAATLPTPVLNVAGIEEITVMVVACSDAPCARPVAAPAFITFRLMVTPTGVEPLAAYERPLKPLAGAGIWSTFQGNAGHTGFVPATLSPAAFAPRYRLAQATPKVINAPLSDIAASDDLFYYSVGGRCCAAPEYATYARREDNAVIAWSSDWSVNAAYTQAAYAPAVADGRVYVVGGELASMSLYVLEATTLTLRPWPRQFFGSGHANRDRDFPAPTIYGGIFYNPVDANSIVFAGENATGDIKFIRGHGLAATGWTPAVDEKHFYQYVNNTLYVSDRFTGEPRHAIAGPAGWTGARPGPAAVLAPPTTVFGIDERTVVAFDTAALQTRWSVSGSFYRNPGYDKGSVFIPNDLTRTLEVRDAANGALLWSWQPDRPADFGSDVLVTNNLVFVSTKLATYAIDRTTHATVWSYPAAGTLALTPNGTLFIKSMTALVAISLH